MSSSDSKIQKIQTHFQALSAVASSLNAVSDEFTRVVGALDEALKKLNIGLTVWVMFEDRSNPADGSWYDCDQIGYCKVSGKWGIAVRHVWGEEPFVVHEEEGPWLFSEAPRDMRLRSVDKIPEVIEALAKEASSTTQKIQEKTKEVRELASAIEAAAKPPRLADKVKASNQTPKSPTLPGNISPGLSGAPLSGKLSEMLGDAKKGGK